MYLIIKANYQVLNLFSFATFQTFISLSVVTTNGNIVGKCFSYFLALISCLGLTATVIVGSLTLANLYVFPREALDQISIDSGLGRGSIQGGVLILDLEKKTLNSADFVRAFLSFQFQVCTS